MSKLFCIILLSLVGVATAISEKHINLQLKLMGEVMNDLLNIVEKEFLDVPECKPIIQDARQTINRIIKRYRSCESLPLDDPPSRIQKMLKDCCVNICHVNLAAELFFIVKDFSAVYIKRGLTVDHVYEGVKDFFMDDYDEIFEDIISKYLPLIFRQNFGKSNYEQRSVQKPIMDKFIDIDLDEIIQDIVLENLFPPHKKYSKPSSNEMENVYNSLRDSFMKDIDLDDLAHIRDIIEELMEESDY